MMIKRTDPCTTVTAATFKETELCEKQKAKTIRFLGFT